MNHPQQTSNCCNAPLITNQSDEGTGYYSCSNCKNACDPQQQESWQEKQALQDEGKGEK